MHPAYSVIFFTTATGAGYGLLALLGVSAGFGLIDAGFWFRFVTLGLALVLISAGLLSSAAHLGRPERAWRAFSQWRSSWLSREGVASVATFVPAGLFGIGWVLARQGRRLGRGDGLLSALCAVATVCDDRHDLRLAEADRAMVEPLHAAGLSDLLGDDGIASVQRAAAGVRTSPPAPVLVLALALTAARLGLEDRDMAAQRCARHRQRP